MVIPVAVMPVAVIIKAGGLAGGVHRTKPHTCINFRTISANIPTEGLYAYEVHLHLVTSTKYALV